MTNMKKILFTLTLALLCTVAYSVPAKRGQWRMVTLADGSKVRVELRGDEFFNYWQAEDGRRFVRNARTAKYEQADMAKLRERAQAMRKPLGMKAGKQNAPAHISSTRAGSSPYVGEKKGLVILVQFPDQPFAQGNTPELYDKILNGKDYTNPDLGFVGSVHDYFYDQSLGKFSVTFDIAGPVTMSEDAEYYGGNDPSAPNPNCKNIGQLLEEAITAVDAEVDFTQYDWNGDGEVDQVFVVFAGLGEANGGDESTIWPHKWQLLGALKRTLQCDGMTIDVYACGSELQPTGYIVEGNQVTGIAGTKIDGIGTICHEFSHCLGLADLYDTYGDGSGYGMDAWDLMSSGSYNGDSFRPACYTGAERMWIGWEQPTELKENTEVNGMKSLEEGGGSYIIRNDAHPDEYYILDNRQRTGRWDAGLPGNGLLITHVDYDEAAWYSNRPNDEPNYQRCTTIPADGNHIPSQRYIQLDGSIYTDDTAVGNDAYPYLSNNTLSNTSTPAAELHNANTDRSYLMNKTVRNITRNDDGTISFIFENENNNPDDFDIPDDYLFYESFNSCNGRGGNDGDFGANATGTPKYDNTGWSALAARPANKCVRLGSTQPGQITSPAISLDGEYTLMFKAASFTGDGKALTVEVKEGEATLDKTQFVMYEGRWSALSTKITGNGPVKLLFKTSEGMFYLDEVCIFKGEATGIDGVTVQPDAAGKPADRRIYSIDGRYVGTDAMQLPKGMYIRGGKKFVRR